MAKNRFQKPDDGKRREFVRHNEQIRVREVLLVREGTKIGIMPTYEALRRAREEGLDLVEVAPQAKPPVCSIMDYGKFMYEKQKKDKGQPHSAKEKEIVFRYVIDIHDMETKANQAKKFLEKGHKVRLVVKFKAREKAHKDQGFEAMAKMLELLQEVATVEKAAAFEGSNIMARVEPKK